MTQIQLIQKYPALILHENNRRALVISDLHLGWERILIQKGVHIPSQTPKIKNNLLNLIKKTKPTQLILLGDIKDAITKVTIDEWKDIPEFFEELQKKVPDIKVILGNHDGNIEPLLPESVKIVPSTGTNFGKIGLFHGHAWPELKLLGCKSLVIGHVHPTVAIRDPRGLRITKQVFVKSLCNKEKLTKALLNHLGLRAKTNFLQILKDQYNIKMNVSHIFIMPSFNRFLGGQPVNEQKKEKKKTDWFLGPILRSGCIKINDAEIYLLDGTFLGVVEQLKALS